jgi:hypothetical protein
MAAAQSPHLTRDLLDKTVSGLWFVDTLVGVFCVAAAVDIGFAPGRTATFEAGTLALVLIFLALLIVLAALAPGFLIHKWLRALERFVGKGVLYVLVGILASSPAVAWRLVPGALTIALGFAYLLLSVVKSATHPRPLFSAGTGSAAGDAAAAAGGGGGGGGGAPAHAAAGGGGGAALAMRGAEGSTPAAPQPYYPQPAGRTANPFLSPPPFPGHPDDA